MKCKNCGLNIEPLPKTDLWIHDDPERPWNPKGWNCDPTADVTTHAEPAE